MRFTPSLAVPSACTPLLTELSFTNRLSDMVCSLRLGFVCRTCFTDAREHRVSRATDTDRFGRLCGRVNAPGGTGVTSEFPKRVRGPKPAGPPGRGGDPGSGGMHV
ncbi:hypothetical protein GCM10010524_51740 [Streptomyces mexicanus]